jgi:hypothetical protein
MKAYHIDFKQNFPIYPSRFVTREVLIQVIFITLFTLFLFIGDYIVTYSIINNSCELYSSTIHEPMYSIFIKQMLKKKL